MSTHGHPGAGLENRAAPPARALHAAEGLESTSSQNASNLRWIPRWLGCGGGCCQVAGLEADPRLRSASPSLTTRELPQHPKTPASLQVFIRINPTPAALSASR